MRRARVWVATLTVLCGASAAVRAESVDGVPRYAIVAALSEAVEAAQQTREKAAVISFDALGRHFALEMERTRLFAPGAKTIWIGAASHVEETPPEVFLSGRLRDEPHSRVRLSRRGSALTGVIVTQDDIYFLEPAPLRLGAASPDAVVVYRQSDLPPLDLGRCGVAHAPAARSAMAARDLGRTAIATAGAQRAEISLVADYEFYRAHGAQTAALMQDTINLVSAIYESEVGVTLTIANTVVYTTAADPFTSSDPGTLLEQFTDYAGSGTSPVHGSDLAHLFTGRDLQGNVIGIAWLGTVCDSAYATGLSQDLSASEQVLVAAHEIGHNFGAMHDPEHCTEPPDGYIMQPNLSCVGHNTFSARSKNDIGVFIDGLQCLGGPAGVPTATPPPTRTRPPGAPTATKPLAPTRTAQPPTPGRTPTPTPGFSAARIPGLVFWLDATQLAGLADGAGVASWPDTSGQRHDAQQPVAAARPAYRAAALRGHPAVHFDGVDDRLAAPSVVAGHQTRTVIVVGRAAAVGAGAMVDLGNSAVPGAGFAVTPEYAVHTGAGERVWQESASRTAPSVALMRLSTKSTNHLAAWINGRQLATARTTAARVETAGDTIVGASSPAAGGGAFAGDLAEILVYNRSLTEGEREQVTAYLIDKYDISGCAIVEPRGHAGALLLPAAVVMLVRRRRPPRAGHRAAKSRR